MTTNDTTTRWGATVSSRSDVDLDALRRAGREIIAANDRRKIGRRLRQRAFVDFVIAAAKPIERTVMDEIAERVFDVAIVTINRDWRQLQGRAELTYIVNRWPHLVQPRTAPSVLERCRALERLKEVYPEDVVDSAIAMVRGRQPRAPKRRVAG